MQHPDRHREQDYQFYFDVNQRVKRRVKEKAHAARARLEKVQVMIETDNNET
jgi:hypothetical protein